jgi:hypothetical protein
MFQVVVQSAMRQLKAKLKLRAPPSNLGEEKTPQEKKQRSNWFYFGLGHWRWNTAAGHVF